MTRHSMSETDKQKQIRRTQEATIYRVQKDFGGSAYRVSKRVIDVEMEVYHVSFTNAGDPWCDCPGFHRQLFAKEKHKHVRAVRDYIARGKPDYADYQFTGVGKHTKIKHIHSVRSINDA